MYVEWFRWNGFFSITNDGENEKVFIDAIENYFNLQHIFSDWNINSENQMNVSYAFFDDFVQSTTVRKLNLQLFKSSKKLFEPILNEIREHELNQHWMLKRKTETTSKLLLA